LIRWFSLLWKHRWRSLRVPALNVGSISVLLSWQATIEYLRLSLEFLDLAHLYPAVNASLFALNP
jgi:hypothetical protein